MNLFTSSNITAAVIAAVVAITIDPIIGIVTGIGSKVFIKD